MLFSPHYTGAFSDTDRRTSGSSDELSRRISCSSDSDLLERNAYETIRTLPRAQFLDSKLG